RPPNDPPDRALATLITRDRHRLDLRSFPTRRSSDLALGAVAPGAAHDRSLADQARGLHAVGRGPGGGADDLDGAASGASGSRERSEEHTSELQSRENLVCRLLLEKKNRRTSTTRQMT